MFINKLHLVTRFYWIWVKLGKISLFRKLKFHKLIHILERFFTTLEISQTGMCSRCLINSRQSKPFDKQYKLNTGPKTGPSRHQSCHKHPHVHMKSFKPIQSAINQFSVKQQELWAHGSTKTWSIIAKYATYYKLKIVGTWAISYNYNRINI